MHAPDWILLDLDLPDMSGEEVLRSLRQEHRTQRIPVTILSADATAGQINNLKAAGAREYLTKPLDVLQLIGLLEDTLRQEQPVRRLDAVPPTKEKPDRAIRWDPEAISLAGLPTALLQQLRSAVQDGEKDRLDELIAAVTNRDPQSGQALKGLADKYDYDALTNLLAEAIQ
jgi:CheY-like chemotaxis protein